MLHIDFVTDFVCPYCVVAREAIDQAAEQLQFLPGYVEIEYHPFELTPPEREQVDTWNDPVRREHYRVLDEPCAQLGLTDVHFPPHVVPRPRTRLAWEAWLMAEEQGRGSVWCACMYRAYFVHQEDIGDPGLLLRYARVLGLNPADLQEAWDTHRYTEELLRREADAKARFDPHGVPTIWCNGKPLSLETYTREEMMEQLENAPKEEAGKGFCCGIDGCG